MITWIILYVLMLVWVWEKIRYELTEAEEIVVMAEITAIIYGSVCFGLGFGLRCMGG